MATEPLLRGLSRLRAHLLDPDALVRAVASGKQKGAEPAWRRAELRYVDLKAGRHLQVTTYDATQAHTHNHPVGDECRDAVDTLLDEPFANWHVDTVTESHQLRVTKPNQAVTATKPRDEPVELARGHDRDKERLLPSDDPLFRALDLADGEGRIKPSRQAKVRQVEEFLRLLDSALVAAIDKGHLRRPTVDDPLRVVDLGCGNAYLTFAAHRYLSDVRGLPVRLTGVDAKEQSRDHSTKVAAELGIDAEFVVGSIGAAVLDPAPEVVLALHACDTATDEALARAVGWGAPLVLAAPCCHHDVAAQLRKSPTPAPYAMLTRHGILRERLADTLTDAIRASLLRQQGYKVDVVQFVESQHTPRNTMLRATRTGGPVAGGGVRKEYDELVASWGIEPKLAQLLGLLGELLAALLLPLVVVGADEPIVELTFQDPEIIESSGLARVGDWLVTTNDSGDSGRVFVVDETGATVGTAAWSAEPRDVEALAPGGADEVWVGDIGDNSGVRDSIEVAPVPVGAQDVDARVPTYELVYPDGARDAESLLVHPVTGRVYVATKEIFGGLLYEAPAELDPGKPNRLTELGGVLPIATDGAFFPDGRHLVIRDYDKAVVYTFPTLEEVGEIDLPDQQQGEGIAVTSVGDLLVSSEGQFSDVLRVPLPDEIVAAMAPPSATPAPTPSPTRPATESREGKDLPETTEVTRAPFPWFLGGFIGLGIIVVLMRSLRRR